MIYTLLDGLITLRLFIFEVSIIFLTSITLGNLAVNNMVSNKIINLMLSLCIGLISLCGITFFLGLISVGLPSLYKLSSFIILIIFSLTIIREVIIRKIDLKNYLAGFHFILLVTCLFILHLSLVNHIILPGYSDSPIHYQIIKQIINSSNGLEINLSLNNIITSYYHFGFHTLTAWLIIISETPIEKAISLIGQISLVLAPISVGSFVYIITKSKNGAFSAGLIVIFGWSMPAFAINWGKFPALLTLSLISSLIAYVILLIEKKEINSRTLFFLLFLFFSISLIHTRAIVILMLAGISIFIAKSFVYEKNNFFFVARVSIFCILLLFPLRGHIADYYQRIPIAVGVLFLIPFAFSTYPKQTAGVFLFISGLWIVKSLSQIFINLPELLNDEFINIMLFIPFSIIGGLGVAGIFNQVTSYLRIAIISIFAILLIQHSPWFVSSFPDPCCDYYRKEDELAFRWIKNNTSQDSLFITSMFYDGEKQYGADAGVWITPLTERNANKLPFDTKWNENIIFSKGCNPNLTDVYIYSGGRDFSFSNKALLNTQWIISVYNSEAINIYKVLKCDGT